MRHVLLGIGLAVVWALVGWAQCTEVPYMVGGTSVTLRFCGNLTVSGGTCSQVASNVVQCSVPEGTTGTVNLSAQRTPAGTVSIGATALPGWASVSPVSGWGSVSGQCRFTVPAGTAGQRFELRFRATAAGVPGEILLTVILNVAAAPVGPQLYGPFTGTTDDAGKFTVPVPGLPNNVRVGGTLTECTVRLLPRTPVTIYVAATAPVQPPSFGQTGFVWASYPAAPVAQQAPSISYVLISAPGYPQMRVLPIRVLPIIIGPTTYTMVDLGTVSFPGLACATRPPDGEIAGRTDGEGKFTVNVGSGTTVSGRLTECTVKPLPNQTFTLTPVFSAGELSEVRLVVPGYPDTTVTKALSVLRLGAMTYVNLGDVCLLPAGPDGTRREGEISGRTDSDGKFTTTLTPGTVVSGRLTICTVTPLADHPFTVTPIRDATGAVSTFEYRVSGHAGTTVTEFTTTSLFGLFTTYDVGDVCVCQAAFEVILRQVVFQPTQAVFQDKNADIDQNYLILNRSDPPMVWDATLPMVKDRNTLLVGSVLATHDRAKSHDLIHLRIENWSCTEREVLIRFSLEEGEENTVLYETDKGFLGPLPEGFPLFTMAHPIKQLVLPAGQPGVLDVFLLAPIPDQPFVFSATGDAKIVVEVLNRDGTRIQDRDPKNQRATVGVSVVETRGVDLRFRVIHLPDAHPGSPPASATALQAIAHVLRHLNTVSAVADLTAGLVQTAFPVPEDSVAHILNPFPFQWETPTLTAQQRADSGFWSEVLKLIQQGWSLQDQPQGGTAAKHRYVALFEYPGLGPPTGLSFTGERSLLFAALPREGEGLLHTVKTVAHELAHTFGVPGSVSYHLISDQARAHGYSVHEERWQRDVLGVMGPRGGPEFWIEQPTYRSVLQNLQQGGVDPEILAVRGIIDRESNVTLVPWYVMTGFEDITADDTGDYSLVFLDDTGRTLAVYRFDLEFSVLVDPIGDVPMDFAPFAFRVLWDPRTTRIEIRGPDDSLLAARDVSATAPTVQMVFPAGGETLQHGQEYTISWTGSDLDGDNLSYTLLFSPDGGEIWWDLDADLTEESYVLDTAYLEPGDQYLIRLIVSDGVLTGEATSGAFKIE